MEILSLHISLSFMLNIFVNISCGKYSKVYNWQRNFKSGPITPYLIFNDAFMTFCRANEKVARHVKAVLL